LVLACHRRLDERAHLTNTTQSRQTAGNPGGFLLPAASWHLVDDRKE
jgi:hypothetical protein